MGSKLLSAHSLLWPPATVPTSHTQKLAVSASSRFAVSFPSGRGCVWQQLAVRRIANHDVLRAVDGVESSAVETYDTLVADEEIEKEKEEVKEKAPRKPIVKLGDIMGILNKRAIEASESERPVPDIRTGDIVEIKLEVPENRRRLSIYKGIVMSRQNAGIHTTIRIRRIIAGIGVEIVFPLYSPNIKEIKVVSHRKVRRARLYYLREKLPRLSTFNVAIGYATRETVPYVAAGSVDQVP